MNKQELIKKFEEIGIHGLNMFGTVVEGIPTETAITLIKQLEEPEKVKVPQFVADWIEESKKTCKTVAEFFSYKYQNIEITKYLLEKGRIDLVARAWLDGYEVEKERRYIVTLKSSGQKLYYHTEDEDYIFSSYDGVFYSGYHTKTDLEENDMSWVFDCPGMEIQEVE